MFPPEIWIEGDNRNEYIDPKMFANTNKHPR